MAHTSLIPGYGFVVVDSTETAVLPGLGFVNLDGGSVTTPATVSFSAGLPGMTTGIGSISSIAAGVSLSNFGPLPGMTSGIGSLSVTSDTQIVSRPAYLRLGVKITPGFSSIRRTRGGVSTEPSIYAEGGLPTTKVVNGQARFRVGPKITAVGQHRNMTGAATLSVGVRISMSYSAIQSGGVQTIARPAQWVTGARIQANGVAIKNGYARFDAAPQITALGVATQSGGGGTGGTSGELSQTSITNIVNSTLYALGVTPPEGLVEATAARMLLKYETGLVDEGLTRLHHERLTSSVLLGNSFGLLTPPGAYVPPVGTLSGFFSYSGHKQRVTARCDGTRNRITLVYDPE